MNKEWKKKDVKQMETKGEQYLFHILDKLIPYEYINHGFYSFLVSPRNGKMQLDRFYPGLNLAFEYQGNVHDHYYPEIHGSYEDFLYYQECDKIKKKQCRQRGITLIEFRYDHLITDESVKQEIQKRAPKLHWYLFKKEQKESGN